MQTNLKAYNLAKSHHIFGDQVIRVFSETLPCKVGHCGHILLNPSSVLNPILSNIVTILIAEFVQFKHVVKIGLKN